MQLPLFPAIMPAVAVRVRFSPDAGGYYRDR